MNDIAQLASLAHSQIPLAQPTEYQQDDGTNGGKRKSDDGQQGSSKSRRSRYISLACNECKRRKIKCNGQTPCQRCGSLNLECVYAPNCCNGFKDSQEYRDMSLHISSLQDQVNVLYDNLNSLRAQLGQSAPMAQAQMQQPQYAQPSSIDPSLQAQIYTQQSGSYQSDEGEQNRPKSQTQLQQPFRGLTNPDFNFGEAKSSLQTVGNGQGDMVDGALAEHSTEDTQHASARNGQLYDAVHGDKDPLWSISKSEAQRLCQIYEDEIVTMYPVVGMSKISAYANKLFPFLESMHRTGLMQQGMPGADAIDDEDTNILKLVLATALTIDGSGHSELATRLFERVQPAIDNLLLGSVSMKGVRLLIMAAVYEFQRENEGSASRLIGLAARSCIELGLHRRDTYETIADIAEREEAELSFWSCYVLDTHWTLGIGTSSALQEAGLDPLMHRPFDSSPYMGAMIKYIDIGSSVLEFLATPALADSRGVSAIAIREMGWLDDQVLLWLRGLPIPLNFEQPYEQDVAQTTTSPSVSGTGPRPRVVLHLRARQLRILIHRPFLRSTSCITGHREQAQKVVDLAKHTIRALTAFNKTNIHRKQQVVYHTFLTSALAVLFLVVSYTPTFFAENVRDEFYMALELVKGLSQGSLASRRLWRTTRCLKEMAPRLGLSVKASQVSDNSNIPGQGAQRQSSKDEIDPNRSAAVAMAGLAGHNVDELALFNQENQQYGSEGGTNGHASMVSDLAYIFEAASGSCGEHSQSGLSQNTTGLLFGEDGLSDVLAELF